jgi:hypothetical protein
MTEDHKTRSLARPLRAFEIDAAWYQSYWYDRPEPERRKPKFRSAHVLVWAVLFVAGAYFAL